LNLTAIFMKYKDQSRAKAVIRPVASQARATDLSTPNIHPSVKDALSALRIR
jgi:hypothetical protein